MSTSLLTINQVKKRYGTHEALKGISFDLFPKEVVSLLGVNGAGKTTLSTIIATLHPPTEGNLLYKGSSVYENLPAYRSIIGYCPQKPNLNPLLTVKQNLVFTGEYYGMTHQAIENRLEELHESLGIYKYLDFKPPQLSGGWRQRYMLARTLIHSPKLIILDEPTVALDPAIRHQLWDHIEHIKKEGVCILLTTHYLEEAERLSDRVVVLHAGEVKLIDTPQNLMTSFKKGRLEEVFIELTHEPKE